MTSDGDDLNLAGAAGSREFNWWGLGVVQEVDAAAMSLWLKYRNYAADDSTATAFEDMNKVTFGALINF